MKSVALAAVFTIALMIVTGCTQTIGTGQCIYLEQSDVGAVSDYLAGQIVSHNEDLNCPSG